MSRSRAVAVGIAAPVLSLLLWGTAVEPRFLLDIQRHEVELPALSAEWSGATVALLADLQVGMWWHNRGMIGKAVDAALDADADLILIAGDFVYAPDTAVVDEAVSLVRPLGDAGIPVLAVFGNHDFSMMSHSSRVRLEIARYLEERLRDVGIRVLENESVAISGREAGALLHVAGVGSAWAGRSDPEEALADVPAGAPRILLMHNPVAFREISSGRAPLTLAAHTHGGQVRLPGLPSESWLHIARPREVVADGWAADTIGRPGNRLYVNRGLGFSRLPLRLFCRPELTLITLRGGAGTPSWRDSAQVVEPEARDGALAGGGLFRSPLSAERLRP